MAYGVNVLLRICASRYHVLSPFGLFTGKNKRSGDSQVATRVKLFHSIFAQRQAFCLSLELYGRLSLTLDNHEPLMHCSTPIKHGTCRNVEREFVMQQRGIVPLQWRHNGRNGVTDHRPLDCCARPITLPKWLAEHSLSLLRARDRKRAQVLWHLFRAIYLKRFTFHRCKMTMCPILQPIR